MNKETMFPTGTVQFGVTPTLWSNDDFSDIDIGIPFGKMLREYLTAISKYFRKTNLQDIVVFSGWYEVFGYFGET